MVSGKSKHRPWTESKSSGSPKVCFSCPRPLFPPRSYRNTKFIMSFYCNTNWKTLLVKRSLATLRCGFIVLFYCSVIGLVFWKRFCSLFYWTKKDGFLFMDISGMDFFFFSNNPFSVKAFIKLLPIFIPQYCWITAGLTVVPAVYSINALIPNSSLHGGCYT